MYRILYDVIETTTARAGVPNAVAHKLEASDDMRISPIVRLEDLDVTLANRTGPDIMFGKPVIKGTRITVEPVPHKLAVA